MQLPLITRFVANADRRAIFQNKILGPRIFLAGRCAVSACVRGDAYNVILEYLFELL